MTKLQSKVNFLVEAYGAEKAARHSGLIGEAFELAVREFLGGRKVNYVKSNGKKDAYITFKLNGKRKAVTAEIKTACGEIDNCCKSQFIIYCQEVDLDIEAERQAVVFTVQEWKDFINGYDGRGKFIKVDSQRGTAHIQSFRSAGRPKASKPIREYIDDCCNERPLLTEWLEELRG